MDFEFLDYLSWRDALVAIVALLALYVLITFLRINRLRNEALRVRELSPGAIRDAARFPAAIQEPETPPEPEPAPARADPVEIPESGKERAFAWNEPPAESPEPDRIAVLEQDMALLRREIGGLRAEVQALRDERERDRETDETPPPPARNVSPFYSDAMRLAAQGNDAANISAMCGISRAEAELVVALAKSGGGSGMAIELAGG
ncbi:MAG: DUF2802 domain-containing protein [Candidatus Accumulibacter sp.]|jgi:hypothetical protein|nr:DUF2802 domain-containing protein [Accumulibacter sp.]